MEYNFSLTRRLAIIFCAIFYLFVICIFLIGFELGQAYSTPSIKGLADSKTEITKNIDQGVTAVQSTVPTVPAVIDKKVP